MRGRDGGGLGYRLATVLARPSDIVLSFPRCGGAGRTLSGGCQPRKVPVQPPRVHEPAGNFRRIAVGKRFHESSFRIRCSFHYRKLVTRSRCWLDTCFASVSAPSPPPTPWCPCAPSFSFSGETKHISFFLKYDDDDGCECVSVMRGIVS